MATEKEFIIGMDLGGTFLKYALGKPNGELVYHGKKPSKGDQPKEVIFEVIFSAIEELLEEARNRNARVVAVGFGSPGAVDFNQGKLLGNTPNLPYWGSAEIKKNIEEKFGLPTWADNDANVMTLAEATQGAAKGHKYVIALTLGTGIGGGILIDGEIYRGVNYAGAELGHVSIDYDGRACNCGGIGCIEQYASATAMVRDYLEKLSASNKNINGKVTTEIIFARAKEGEPEAIKTIDETCDYLGAALASIINAFNPEIIVIGGGVSEAGDEFIQQIWKSLNRRARGPVMKGLKLVRASLGNSAGMVGAISLASQMFYKKSRS